MIKKLFIGFFVLFIGFGFFYQKKYVANLKNQYKVQLPSNRRDEKLTMAEGFDFTAFFYNQNGTLKGSLSGKKILYYQDASFFAQGDLVYQGYNALSEPIAMVKTDSAIGEFEVLPDKSAVLFSGIKQLKWLRLQGNVSFNFNENRGTTKNVFIDALKQTISSNEHFSSQGPNGSISADGFFYDIDKKEFQFNANVNGTFKPPKQNRK